MTRSVADVVSRRAYAVSIDLTWTATGPISRDVTNDPHSTTPGFVVENHFQGSFRPAQAVGTVVVGSTNYTPTASYDAEVQDLKTGQVRVTVRPGAPTSATAPERMHEIASPIPLSTWGRLKLLYR